MILFTIPLKNNAIIKNLKKNINKKKNFLIRKNKGMKNIKAIMEKVNTIIIKKIKLNNNNLKKKYPCLLFLKNKNIYSNIKKKEITKQ